MSKRIVRTYATHSIGDTVELVLGRKAVVVECLGQDGSGLPGLPLLTAYVVELVAVST